MKITLKVIQPFRVFPVGYEFVIDRNLTLLVGDNGSGKSSILQMLLCNEHGIYPSHYSFEAEGLDHIAEGLLFDTEKHNPRFRYQEMWNPDSDNFVDQVMGLMRSKHLSHGQNLLPHVKHAFRQKGKLILVDEPESGISLSNQYLLVKYIKEAAKHNVVVIATHSYIFMKELGNIFNMDNDKYMKSAESTLEYFKNKKGMKDENK